MMNATFFGEITELDSRAVWYSDEEDEDEDETENPDPIKKSPAGTPTHESLRADLQFNFRQVAPGWSPKFDSCIVSLLSSSQFKNLRISPAQPDGATCSCVLLGYFDVLGKAFAYSTISGNQTETCLWLVFDTSNRIICGHEVGYFVDRLRGSLQKDFIIDSARPMLILSQQFSSGEHLEYLSNTNSEALKLPFNGRPLQPPSLIKNHFESALFEQLTLVAKPAVIVCLPAPRNFWFDRANHWPSVPMQIVESRLSDDNLEKTLIFT